MEAENQREEVRRHIAVLSSVVGLNSRMEESFFAGGMLDVAFDPATDKPREGMLKDDASILIDVKGIVRRFASRRHACVYYVHKYGPLLIINYVEGDESLWAFRSPKADTHLVPVAYVDLRKRNKTIKYSLVPMKSVDGYLVIDH